MKTDKLDETTDVLKDRRQMIETYFETHGIPVVTKLIRGGLSIFTQACKTPMLASFPREKRVVSRSCGTAIGKSGIISVISVVLPCQLRKPSHM